MPLNNQTIVGNLRHTRNGCRSSHKKQIYLILIITTNEVRLRHVLPFKCLVEVDGKTYTTPNLFSNTKIVEQEAAALALDGISKKIKDCESKKMTEGGFPTIYQVCCMHIICS